MKIINFTFGGQLCIETAEGDEIEVEIGPERYRAMYEQDLHERITHIWFEMNDAREGKPDCWVHCHLPYEAQIKVMKQIYKEFEDEQQRTAALEDV